MGEFVDKVVVITGAGGHVGKVLARMFAREGAKVAGVDINQAALDGFEAAVAEVAGRSVAVACDLRDWSALERAAKEIVGAFGGIDILVNTATARTNPVWKALEDSVHEEMTELMEVGPNGMLGAMLAVLPYLKAKGGKIINFGSGSGRNPAAGLGTYGVSKAAVHSLTKIAAKEWGKYNITVNGVLPFMMTPNLERTLREEPEKIEPFLPPLRRVGDPERDIGRVVMFLASDAASFVTGQNLPVDGGGDMVM
ncbi:MAG: SDR family NAD(P)-dependent oxidoreductase [Caulobacterales bacterium]|jgi:NAD(P)-dependent dehydrogenase (short-subunit alcohol dehydrogenase family)